MTDYETMQSQLNKVEGKLNTHETECKVRYDWINFRFDKIDKTLWAFGGILTALMSAVIISNLVS